MTEACCQKIEDVSSCLVFIYFLNWITNLAKLDSGLDKSPTVMVGEEKQNTKNKTTR